MKTDKIGLNISGDDSIIIFGCGNWGKILFQYLKFLEYDIEAFCDNNDKLWNEKFYDIFIYSPEFCAKQFANHMFIIACKHSADIIHKQLTELNIPIRQIRILDTTLENREYMRSIAFQNKIHEMYFVDNTLRVEPGYKVVAMKGDLSTRHFRILLDNYLFEKMILTCERDFFDYLAEFEGYYGSYISVDKLSSQGTSVNSVKLLMACCHKDKKVSEDRKSSLLFPIQCGKALTDIQMSELTDDVGDNISEKNGNYCECTALYWAWKNGWAMDSDYIGLRHYRRRLRITDEQLQQLSENGIDMVLMEPTYIESISGHFLKGACGKKDWDVLRQAIKAIMPEYYESFINFENQHMVCQCNLFVMRRKLFDEYAEYLFSILDWIDNYYSLLVERNDRYLGYLAECLTSLFAMHNRDRLKLVFADMEILESEDAKRI